MAGILECSVKRCDNFAGTNPNLETNSKLEWGNLKTRSTVVLNFRFAAFGFVSEFGFGCGFAALGLGLPRGKP
jgi:hypothetical protein